MNSSAFSTPVRRTAAALTTAAIALGPVLLGATSAHAAPRDGKAGAVVLRANLNVKALNVAEVPLNVVLNDVDAPANENEALLNAKVKGINGGRSFNMIKAQVATADAKVNKRRAVGEAKLTDATVRLPGLNIGDPLVRVKLATAKALCVAGEKPRAHSKVVGLTVLGKPVTVPLHGTRKVPHVEGVGDVTLGLAETRTTARNAIATAVRLNVTVHTLAQTKVKGSVVLSQATCRAPLADEGDDTGGNTSGGEDNGGNTTGDTTGGEDNGGNTTGDTTGGEDNGGNTTGETDGGATEGNTDGGNTEGDTAGTAGTAGDTAGDDGGATTGGGGLAETGSSSTTPYLAAGAGVLMVAGAGALVLTRRRKAAAQQD